jgi:hypothetical protein
MHQDFDGRSRWLCSTTRGFGLRRLLKSTSADVPGGSNLYQVLQFLIVDQIYIEICLVQIWRLQGNINATIHADK